ICRGVGCVRSPQSHSLSMLMGMMRAICGSHQRRAYGCSNLFQTICHSLAAYLQQQVVWV
ncbi:hypothetical protein, partial [Vibrio sp. V27_P1S3P104]|uniref:hypothetical protein n=1 Tax=Vibrio sp. V27_P1S3P104 TaxID=1938679 RepID=UPI002351706F